MVSTHITHWGSYFDATFSSPFIIEHWLELIISYILNIILSYSMECHDIHPTFYFFIAGKPSATREVQHGQHREGKSNTAGTEMFALYGKTWWPKRALLVKSELRLVVENENGKCLGMGKCICGICTKLSLLIMHGICPEK